MRSWDYRGGGWGSVGGCGFMKWRCGDDSENLAMFCDGCLLFTQGRSD